MPSHSAAQHRLMEAVLHDPKVAKKTGISQSVAKDFVEADRGRPFSSRKKAQTKSAALLERCARKLI